MDEEEINYWLQEEEFISNVLADINDIPFYVIGKKHHINNLADLFFSTRPSIYLSYPITAIQKENPELIKVIENEYLPKLEEKFIVFNPLVIKDLEKTKNIKKIEEISGEDFYVLGVRTVVRDYRFVEQSDFLVVIYNTEKLSTGVIAEIIYASTHNTPVYMVYPYHVSPFLDEYATIIFPSFEKLLAYISNEEFIKKFPSRKCIIDC
jgi:hypothetical protein